MKHLYFSIILGLAPVFGLHSARGEQAAPAEHKHEDGSACTADHGHDDHQHKAGETCTQGHAHKEHRHADGTVCTGDHEHEKAAEKNSGQPGDMIPVHVDEKARHSLDMRFEKVAEASHGAAKTLHGQMVIPPHAVTTYALPAAGRVTFNVKSAQQVRKGELLYILASPDIVEMEGNASQARAALDRAAAELGTLRERRAQLEKIGTRNSELNTSIQFKEAEIHSLRAALTASNNKLKLVMESGVLKNNLLYIYAAADGSVQSVNMTQGAWGEQGAPALVMTNKGDLEFSTTIYGADPVHYAKAQLALTSGKNTELLNGTLRVAEQVDPATQSRALYFTPDHLPEGTHAGQLARLDLYSHDAVSEGFIPVPNSAVVKVGVNDVVFIKAGDDTFVMKKVETQPSRQGKTPVRGLIPGQTIVTKGGYELKYILPTGEAGSKKAAGHFHADGQFHEGEH
ncbi:efflux RND transporter periplasmic adaptor subunit [Akkermansia sp.]|uniref:efflux RND transporter periplasmic adaptor subunit n=1 Tax=Akkermansia sp. TaxID=1872421 RepID=UPI003AB55ECB